MTHQQTEPIIVKPRKNPHLWQAYLLWRELMEMRKRHLLRISAAERGASNLDAQWEKDVIEEFQLDALLKKARDLMIGAGESVGPIWECVTAIRGLGEGSLAAQLLAQIDDIALFPTVSRLWRYCGYGVYDYWVDAKGNIVAPKDGYKERRANGKRDRYYVVAEPKEGWRLVKHRDVFVPGWCAPYSKLLKSIGYLIADQFVKQHSIGYRELYDQFKAADLREHPVMMCRECQVPWEQCAHKRSHHKLYNPGHLHHRAMRRTIKVFLQHLWVTWRALEGLPVSDPWVLSQPEHSHYIAPHECGWPVVEPKRAQVLEEVAAE